MLAKVAFWTPEEGERLETIAGVLLNNYPYEGWFRETTASCSKTYSFFIKRRDANLFRHDLKTLKMCGFRVIEVL